MAMPVYSSIPIMYHPTNIVLLDDELKFLNDLSLVISPDIPYVLTDKPEEAADYLRSHAYSPNALSALLTEQIYEGKPGGKETFSIEYSQLLKILNSPDRFKKSVVAAIDRHMKLMDGLDFCFEIREKKVLVKLILFTARTGLDEVVAAFNKKTIDAYLMKEGKPAELVKKLTELYEEYSRQQFIELGKALTGLLSHVLKPLSDEQFINVFVAICKRYKAVEFYLLDSSCSFLIIDRMGKAWQFFVRKDADFKDCYEIATNNKAPYEVLQAIRGRQMFPYTEKDMGYSHYEGDAWEDIMVNMEKVPGRELYYAVIERPDIKLYAYDK